MSKPKFLLGDTIVTAEYSRDRETFEVEGPDFDTWHASLEMVKEHYTPVSVTGERHIEIAENHGVDE